MMAVCVSNTLTNIQAHSCGQASFAPTNSQLSHSTRWSMFFAVCFVYLLGFWFVFFFSITAPHASGNKSVTGVQRLSKFVHLLLAHRAPGSVCLYWICSTVCYGQDEMACHLHSIHCTWDVVTMARLGQKWNRDVS